ncbi:bifunctional glutamate N-acetyltransferase/amino-acid acetyltransferase ArgJ [Candidatus Haliotispira prima]|uniref:Arginine biosynthesis bifunctional protein ArgJ n=1 Tax=Candidatus Haliotispira prima TaxID=3034016 RepID=A0ABY8MIN9_9SPIO|nr:bifunctional glutamate N-acetyltransferase/amino-acid acetyltransferase ArgJ [Candidatus Haliotispira prima]
MSQSACQPTRQPIHHSPAIRHLKDGHICSPQGFSADGAAAGFRPAKPECLDLAVLYSQQTAHAAGVFTRNLFCAAPVTVTRDSLHKESKLQALLCNSGQANAGTGEEGLKISLWKQQILQQKLRLGQPHYAAVMSTGVIGVLPDKDKIAAGLEKIKLGSDAHSARRFSQAILTTDTCTKTSAYRLEIDGKPVTLAGSAKGSGMIHPNMATMLAFITTDASVEPLFLQELLRSSVERSFNRISVDGDTSTNDTVLILANGLAGNREINRNHPDWKDFRQALEMLCQDLAKAIIRDGEGATKFIEVEVISAPTEQDAALCARHVVSSNLFKTAMYGEDINWGRIACAVGNSGAKISTERLSITLGREDDPDAICVLDSNNPRSFSEETAARLLSRPEIYIRINLHQGLSHANAWGNDLSLDYVKINAHKRS